MLAVNEMIEWLVNQCEFPVFYDYFRRFPAHLRLKTIRPHATIAARFFNDAVARFTSHMFRLVFIHFSFLPGPKDFRVIFSDPHATQH